MRGSRAAASIASSYLLSKPPCSTSSASMSSYVLPGTTVLADVALEDTQHRITKAHGSVPAATYSRTPWKKAMGMLVICSALEISLTPSVCSQTAAHSRVTSHGASSSSRSSSIADAVDGYGITNRATSRNRSISSRLSKRSQGGGSIRASIAGKGVLSVNRSDRVTSKAPSENNTLTQHGALHSQRSPSYDTAREPGAVGIATGPSWKRLHAKRDQVDGRQSFADLRHKSEERVAHAGSATPRRDTAAVVGTAVSPSYFVGTAAATADPRQLPVQPLAVAAVSAPLPLLSPLAPPPDIRAAVSQTASPATTPVTGGSSTIPGTATAATVTPTTVTPAIVSGLGGAAPATVLPATVAAPGTVAASTVPTKAPMTVPEAAVASKGTWPAHTGDGVMHVTYTGSAPAAAGGAVTPLTEASEGVTMPAGGVLVGQPQPPVAQSPAEEPVPQTLVTSNIMTPGVDASNTMTPVVAGSEGIVLGSATNASPLVPVAGGSGTPEGAVGAEQSWQAPALYAQPFVRTEVTQPQQAQQQEQFQQGNMQGVVQEHVVRGQQLKQLGEDGGVKTPSQEPSVPVYDRGTRVIPAAHFSPSAAGDNSRRACFDACECWPVWASSIAALVLYSAATLAAVLMTANLFSKGLLSSSFYKGGGYWLLGATAAGAATGASIGGLVAHCLGAALGLCAGMMCLSASLVLLGSSFAAAAILTASVFYGAFATGSACASQKAGAWLGALGGVMTGGVIGAMTKGGATSTACKPAIQKRSIDSSHGFQQLMYSSSGSPSAHLCQRNRVGAGIGLLLGIICGFVPLARHLKMNERYIRRGMALGPAAARSTSPSRMPTRRALARAHTTRTPKDQYGRLLDAAGSSSEDIRSLAVQRLSSNPISRIRSSAWLAATDQRPRSTGSDMGSTLPHTASETTLTSTAQNGDSVQTANSAVNSA